MRILYSGLLLISLALTACQAGDQDQQASTQKTFTVPTASAPLDPLYFNSFVEPLQLYKVISPAEGNVNKIQFDYGDTVAKGQPLLQIDADSVAQEYQAALTDFIKAKNTLNQSDAKYRSSVYLQSQGFISQDELNTDKTAFETDKLALIQARFKLLGLMTQLNISQSLEDVVQLDLSDSEKILRILESELDKIQVKAPDKGVVLSQDPKGKEDALILTPGVPVKAGDILLYLGDLTGLSFEFNVNEIDISKIKVGQSVEIESPAFPEIKLKGAVTQVSEQTAADVRGVPVFPVQVQVPHINAAARSQIRIGMSAKLKLLLQKPKAIYLPLSLVYEQDGKAWVKRLDPSNQKVQAVAVKVGSTTASEIEILYGIEPGDRLVYPD